MPSAAPTAATVTAATHTPTPDGVPLPTTSPPTPGIEYDWPSIKSQISTTIDVDERYATGADSPGPLAKLAWIWNQNMPGRHI
jgi:hypothetical protein